MGICIHCVITCEICPFSFVSPTICDPRATVAFLQLHCVSPSSAQSMKMDSAVEAQQGAETAVTETENQQITSAQIATLAQVTLRRLFSDI